MGLASKYSKVNFVEIDLAGIRFRARGVPAGEYASVRKGFPRLSEAALDPTRKAATISAEEEAAGAEASKKMICLAVEAFDPDADKWIKIVDSDSEKSETGEDQFPVGIITAGHQLALMTAINRASGLVGEEADKVRKFLRNEGSDSRARHHREEVQEAPVAPGGDVPA